MIFRLSSPYRDDFRVMGYRFGKGERSCCIIGSLRGNEIQQLYMCGQLVNVLKQLESKGDIAHDREILIIPSINNYGTNLSKSFWCLDNTDVNRTFPGNAEGETTERIAAGVFSEISAYQYGVQFASFYIPGVFIPHVRMMKTNKENAALANLFGLPYVILRTPNFLDQGTLNYNWQLGNTSAFSVYTNATESIDTGIRRHILQWHRVNFDHPAAYVDSKTRTLQHLALSVRLPRQLLLRSFYQISCS